MISRCVSPQSQMVNNNQSSTKVEQNQNNQKPNFDEWLNDAQKSLRLKIGFKTDQVKE